MKRRHQFIGIILGTSILLTSYNSAVSLEELNEVAIGEQVWMTKNLDVDVFRNGDQIPHVESNEDWEKAGKNEQPAWCYNNNDPVKGQKYGKLYNWHAVNDPRGLAPVGWHIPSNKEWSQFIKFLGGKSADVKINSKEGWWPADRAGTNESGFSALPGGQRFNTGDFVSGAEGFWWSSTGTSSFSAWYFVSSGKIFINTEDKRLGFSVRCLKD